MAEEEHKHPTKEEVKQATIDARKAQTKEKTARIEAAEKAKEAKIKQVEAEPTIKVPKNLEVKGKKRIGAIIVNYNNYNPIVLCPQEFSLKF